MGNNSPSLMHVFKKILVFVFLLMVLAGHRAVAQPFNLTESVQPIELTFTDYKKDGEDSVRGKISMNPLTQDKDTMYYFIKGLSMYSPTYFSLNTTDPDADIKINLCKENWHVFHKTGEIKGKSIWKSNFKTEGDFGIMVIAKKMPVRYVLLVWTGKEMNIAMPSVFKGSDTVGGTGGGWFRKNMTIILVTLVALAIIGFLLFKLKKKKISA